MAKQSGLGDNFYVDGYDLSGDIGAIDTIRGGPSTHNVTPINKHGFVRIGGLRDGGMEFTSFFNPSTDQAHPVLSALPRADVVVSYFRGQTLGGVAACCIGKQINYDPERADDGALTFSVSAESNGYGVEWGKQATPGVRTDGSATDGASIDFGTGSTSFGLQAWLQVFDFTGTSATVKLQGSSDNGAGDAWADVTGGGFTAATGRTSQRIQTARNQTVERYLRVVTTGTFSDVVFAVMVARNDTEVKF